MAPSATLLPAADAELPIATAPPPKVVGSVLAPVPIATEFSPFAAALLPIASAFKPDADALSVPSPLALIFT